MLAYSRTFDQLAGWTVKIGLMLRAHDRPGGIGIYSKNIVKHLLEIDSDNHYVLMYNNPDHVGSYSHLDNVDELYAPPANPLIWDQWVTPRLMKKWAVDLIFHTKFTVPLATRAKTIMALHGASWYVHPEIYGKFDVFYVKCSMPIYCRRADFMISNSDLTTKDHIELLDVPPEKISTVYFAAGKEFHCIDDVSVLDRIRKKYDLPDRFMLTVTSYDPAKNFATLLSAFEICREEDDIHLVVAGKNCARYGLDHDIRGRGLEGVIHFPGWINHDDLPAIYNLATVYAFPSIYETFGIPVLESMACGCPVVSSDRGAVPELVGDAALMSDAMDADALARNLLKIVTSAESAQHYRAAGLEQVKKFSWTKTAQQTLKIFQDVVGA